MNISFRLLMLGAGAELVYANSKFCKKNMKSSEIRLTPTSYLNLKILHGNHTGVIKNYPLLLLGTMPFP